MKKLTAALIFDTKFAYFIALSLHIKTLYYEIISAQKMKFSIKAFFSKCDQICRKLRIWSHSLEKSSMENFIFCVVYFSRFCDYKL